MQPGRLHSVSGCRFDGDYRSRVESAIEIDGFVRSLCEMLRSLDLRVARQPDGLVSGLLSAVAVVERRLDAGVTSFCDSRRVVGVNMRGSSSSRTGLSCEAPLAGVEGLSRSYGLSASKFSRLALRAAPPPTVSGEGRRTDCVVGLQSGLWADAVWVIIPPKAICEMPPYPP